MPQDLGVDLYFDLETVPDWKREADFELDPLPSTAETDYQDMGLVERVVTETVADIKSELTKNPPETWLNALHAQEQLLDKPRKGVVDAIADCRKAKRAAEAAADGRKKLLSVTPEYCRIVALGFAVGNSESRSVCCFEDDPKQEREVLRRFWALAEKCETLIGYNVIDFDLPVIFFRSALLGVEPSRLVDTRPWGTDVIDVYRKRFGRNPAPGQPGSLKKQAKAMGLEIPAGDFDGSQVEEAIQTPEGRETVAKYVCSDVDILRAAHRFYRGFMY